MKYFILLVMAGGLIFGQSLSPEQMAKLRNYNHKMSVKIAHKRMLQRMAIVKKDEAKKIALESLDREKKNIQYIKLMHRFDRIFYQVRVNNISLKIDALDGSIIEKKSQK